MNAGGLRNEWSSRSPPRTERTSLLRAITSESCCLAFPARKYRSSARISSSRVHAGALVTTNRDSAGQGSLNSSYATCPRCITAKTLPRIGRALLTRMLFRPSFPRRHSASGRGGENVKSNVTLVSKRFAICSIRSNDGALIPRSIKLRKSTETPMISANCSCVSLRAVRIDLRRSPKELLRERMKNTPILP